MWTASQEQPRTAAVTLLLLCFLPAFQERASVVLERVQSRILHHPGSSAYSCTCNTLTRIIKARSLPPFDWNFCSPPLHHPDEIKPFLVEKLCAIKRSVCPCSAVTTLSLELWSFLHHPPSSRFIKFSSPERPVPHSFHVLHFCILGGGSSLQTHGWCSPFHGGEWDEWEQAGLAHCCMHGALRQHWMRLYSQRGPRSKLELWTSVVCAVRLLIHSLVLFLGLLNDIWDKYSVERSAPK